jgi:predicted phage terminase large subunit-like protein
LLLRNYDGLDCLPRTLNIYGASDYATMEPQKGKKEPDYTEHGIWGVDKIGDLWAIDWWFGQKETDESVKQFLRLVGLYKPRKWWNEGGTLDKGIGPFIRSEMRRKQKFVSIEHLPSLEDKGVKLQAFHARAEAGTVHFPLKRPWAERVIDQLVKFPSGRFDDGADVCGLIGRGVDKMMDAKLPSQPRRDILVPFTEKWLTHNDREQQPEVRFFP